jgi:hypothetical protein
METDMSTWGWIVIAFVALPWVYVLMRLAGKGWAKSYYEELKSVLKK